MSVPDVILEDAAGCETSGCRLLLRGTRHCGVTARNHLQVHGNAFMVCNTCKIKTDNMVVVVDVGTEFYVASKSAAGSLRLFSSGKTLYADKVKNGVHVPLQII